MDAVRMVTLKQIAARCECSVATVSKALNDMPDISPATASHIRSVAAEMGYLPNAAARALKTSKSKTIGLFTFLRGESVWTHDYFSKIADSIQRVMNASGYDIAPIDSDGQMLMNSYVDYCRYRNYDGIIIVSTGKIDSRMQDLVNSDIPLVTIDYSFHGRSAVMSDNVQGVKDLVRYGFDKGHRRIAFVYGEESAVTNNRLASFYNICDELGLPLNEQYIRQGQYRDTDSSAQITRELMALETPPTLILYPDDYAYIGGWNELTKLGLSVPNDVSCMGYDGIPISQLIMPKLATLMQDSTGLGENAARMLLKAIVKPRNYIPEQLTLPGRLIIGESVRTLSGESQPDPISAHGLSIVQIYLTEVPSFSLMYRPGVFHSVNESVWTNYPDATDGRNIPPSDCTDGYGIAALYGLELVAK